MIYRVTRGADTGVNVVGGDVWHERLGWAYGLIASDPAERAAALVRLTDAERTTQDAWDRLNRAWRPRYSLGRRAADRNYREILRPRLRSATEPQTRPRRNRQRGDPCL